MVTDILTIPLPSSERVFSTTAKQSDGTRGGFLSDFISGPENRLAGFAARTLMLPLSRPSLVNPLVLCGPSGCGKSHLAYALAGAWQASHPDGQVVVATVEQLLKDITSGGDPRQAAVRRKRYRNADLLLIEDIQALRGRQTAQYELQATIDTLLDSGGMLIITAPTTPTNLPWLSTQLASRLSGGLIVPLTLPSLETRKVILQTYAAAKGIQISNETIATLADALSVSPRELVTAVDHFADQHRNAPTPVATRSVNHYLGCVKQTKRVSLDIVTTRVAKYYGLKVADLKGPSRRRFISNARSISMFLARRRSGQSLKKIGKHLGNRDHTTVLHGCRKIEEQLTNDAPLQKVIAELEESLTAWARG